MAMEQRENTGKLRKIIVYVSVALIIVLGLYFVGKTWLQAQLSRDAESIENAVLRDCSIVIAVEPETVPVYDILYWSTINRVPVKDAVHVACGVPRDEWQCTCGSSP